MSNYNLYLGDCLEIVPTLPDNSVDAIIADWPYGVTRCKWDSVIPLDNLWPECKRVIKPRGAIVLFGSQPFTSALIMSNIDWFKYCLVWEKDRATGFLDANRKPLKCHEDIVVFSDGQTTYNPQKTTGHPPVNNPGKNRHSAKHYSSYAVTSNSGSTERFPRSVIFYNGHNSAHGVLHPTQKPVALLEYLIRTYTNAGDTVLDNTMGSGTTGAACINTGRKFIGIEKDPGYFEIAKKRIEQAQPALFEVA